MIGPTFQTELVAAGAQLDGLAWGEDGTLSFDPNYPPVQRTLVESVLAAHEPNGKAARNLEIDLLIDEMERGAMIARPVREGLLIVWQVVAQQALGASLADLLNPASSKYHAGFARAYASDQSIAALRAQKEP
jgi:hypothetical protein